MIRYTGHIPEDLWVILRACWKRPIKLQSDLARQYPVEVGLAASMGLISTLDPDGSNYNTTWRITAAGLSALEAKEYMT